jgi:hypothetical protein
MNLAAASTDVCRENSDGGGDSRHLGPIPSTERLRAATRTFLARQGSTGGGGGRRTAALGGCHGSKLGYREEARERGN